jgi:hypothetical protein
MSESIGAEAVLGSHLYASAAGVLVGKRADMCAHLRLGLLHILIRLLIPLTQPFNALGAQPELGDPVLTAIHQIAVI